MKILQRLTEFIGLEKNPSYEKKRLIMHGGENFIGTINLGLFRQQLFVPGFVKMKLTFTKALNEFLITNIDITDKAPKLKIELTRMCIYTRVVDVVPSVFNAHVQGLKTQNLMYHINREVTIGKSIPQGTISETLSSNISNFTNSKIICIDICTI